MRRETNKAEILEVKLWQSELDIKPTNQSGYLVVNYRKRKKAEKVEKQGSDWKSTHLRSSHLRWGKVVKSSAGTSFNRTSSNIKIFTTQVPSARRVFQLPLPAWHPFYIWHLCTTSLLLLQFHSKSCWVNGVANIPWILHKHHRGFF